MNRKLLMLALACAAGPVLAAGSQVYKWTDANGIVHYSDAPPPKETQNVKTVRVTGGDRPHATAAESGNAESTDKPASADAKAPPAPPGSMPDTPDNRAKACNMARSNLELLQSKFPVSTTGADGKPQVLDDKGRQAQIADANAQIALYCK